MQMSHLPLKLCHSVMVRPLLARYWFSGRRERVVCWCLENCRFPRAGLPGATLAHFSCHISPCNTSLFFTSYVSFFRIETQAFFFCHFVQVGRNCNLGRVSQSCWIARIVIRFSNFRHIDLQQSYQKKLLPDQDQYDLNLFFFPCTLNKIALLQSATD